MIKILFSLLLLTCISGIAQAAEMPAKLKPYITKGQIVGQGRLMFGLWSIYDVQLFAGNGVYAPNKPIALVYSYLRNVKGKDIADSSRDEIKRLGMKDPAKLAAWHTQLVAMIPDVHKGTVMSAVHIPGKQTIFLKNGKVIGAIRDKEFGRYFFDIWLSPKTKEPKLRAALLGKTPS